MKKFTSPLVALSLALVLFSCITDGPNKTGQKYLTQNEVNLSQRLDSTEILEIPVDSFWTSIQSSQNILVNNSWAIGHFNGFTASTRLGFVIPKDTSRKALDSIALYIQPQTDTTRNKYFLENWSNLDSVNIQVKSFFPDSASYTYWENLLFLKEISSPAFLSLIPYKNTDTVIFDTVSLKNFLGSNTTPQKVKLSLTNCSKYIRQNPSVAKRIFFELSPLNFQQTWISFQNSDTLVYKYKKDSLSNQDSTVKIVPANSPLLQSKYPLRSTKFEFQDSNFTQPSLLSPVSQYVHFRISRNTLLSALNTAGRPLPKPIQDPTGKNYNLQYFIAKAAIQIPLDTTKSWSLGNLAYNARISTEMDSLNLALSGNANFSIPLNQKVTGKHYIYNSLTKKVSDTISYQYKSVSSTEENSSDFLFITSYSRDTSKVDTAFVQAGKLTKKTISIGSTFLELWLNPSLEEVGVSSSLYKPNVSSSSSPNPLFRNTYSSKIFDSKSSHIEGLATAGIQRMLNRTGLKDSLLHDFSITLDSSFSSKSSTTNLKYSTLGVIPLQVDGNKKLKVKLKVYYIPLDN